MLGSEKLPLIPYGNGHQPNSSHVFFQSPAVNQSIVIPWEALLPWMPFCFRNQLIRYSEASKNLQWFWHPNWFNQKGLFCPSTNLLSTCRFESDEKKRVTLRGPVKANSMRRKGTEKKRKTGEVKWERVAEIPNFVEFSRILSHFPVSTYLLPSHLSA